MRFFTVAFLGLAASALANPVPGPHTDLDKSCHGCIPQKDANEIIDAYKRLIGAFNVEDANKYLADDWVDVSQSINTFIGKPENAPTFNKTSFIVSQSNPQTPAAPLEIADDSTIVTCNKIVIVWKGTFGKGVPVRGISIIEVVKQGGQWQMQHWDVEFNSLNWLENMGGSYCVLGRPVGNPAACPPPTN